jgi:hypothetical protein
MSALATNYIVSNGNYINTDLNAIFAPISRGAVDYGTFDVSATYLGTGVAQSYIGEAWCLFNTPVVTASAGNITTIPASGASGGGFTIVNSGFYRLYITLFFTGANVQETYQKFLFILNSSSLVPNNSNPANLTVTFTPSPNMSQIYSINCSGGASTNNAAQIFNINNSDFGYSNTANNANLLSVTTDTSSPSTNPYYFASFASSNRSNINTLDITFNATAGQDIYPQIVCQGFGTNYDNPQNTLDGIGSKWTFFKL